MKDHSQVSNQVGHETPIDALLVLIPKKLRTFCGAIRFLGLVNRSIAVARDTCLVRKGTGFVAPFARAFLAKTLFRGDETGFFAEFDITTRCGARDAC